ncbi:hypothetical protein GW17_00057610 [Ensete ventricosum]|nr:hypothetical protein GW17_00057610 [Ensete ventricosum]
MGLATPWHRKGGTSMESLISCSHGGRALVTKGAEEVENVDANNKYQDKAKGKRPGNFIRPMSTGFLLRKPKVMDFRLMQECSTKERSMQYVVLYFFNSEDGKAPYHPIRTGMAGDRYADRPLQGGTAKIDRRRLISAVSGRLKKKR